jgi:DNA-binding NarL/FixJ family response regulator
MMRLMIVDDNPDMRRLIKSLIGDLAEVACECSDGSEALRAYRAHQPDWVLMDIEMAKVDGLQATRQIIAAFPEARVVIVSQHPHPDWREEARRAGACEYLLKENLFEVRRLLRK